MLFPKIHNLMWEEVLQQRSVGTFLCYQENFWLPETRLDP